MTDGVAGDDGPTRSSASSSGSAASHHRPLRRDPSGGWCSRGHELLRVRVGELGQGHMAKLLGLARQSLHDLCRGETRFPNGEAMARAHRDAGIPCVSWLELPVSNVRRA